MTEVVISQSLKSNCSDIRIAFEGVLSLALIETKKEQSKSERILKGSHPDMNPCV